MLANYLFKFTDLYPSSQPRSFPLINFPPCLSSVSVYVGVSICIAWICAWMQMFKNACAFVFFPRQSFCRHSGVFWGQRPQLNSLFQLLPFSSSRSHILSYSPHQPAHVPHSSSSSSFIFVSAYSLPSRATLILNIWFKRRAPCFEVCWVKQQLQNFPFIFFTSTWWVWRFGSG